VRGGAGREESAAPQRLHEPRQPPPPAATAPATGRQGRSGRLGSGSGHPGIGSGCPGTRLAAPAGGAAVVLMEEGMSEGEEGRLRHHPLRLCKHEPTPPQPRQPSPPKLHAACEVKDYRPSAARGAHTREGEPCRHLPGQPDGHAGGQLWWRRGGRGGEGWESGGGSGVRPCRPAWGSDAGERFFLILKSKRKLYLKFHVFFC